MKKKEVYLILFLTAILFLLFFSLEPTLTKALSTLTNSTLEMNLTIWDDTDNGGTKRSGWNMLFYANYTNSSKYNIESNCTIRFNFTGNWGSWDNMTYNTTGTNGSEPYYYYINFTYKGTHFFEVNCSNETAEMNHSENFTIKNSVPSISKEDSSDWINYDGNSQNHDAWPCTEDIICYYNFSANVTESDTNDVLTYSNGTNTTLTNWTLDLSTGMLEINITLSSLSGSGKKIELKVKDTDSLEQPGLLEIDVAEVNDAPIFQNLENISINASSLYSNIVYASDEENNVPFIFNVTFTNCTLANWSTRNNCTLFSLIDYNNTATNITFNTDRHDVGTFIVNFTVTDNATGTGFANSSRTIQMNYTINNVNLLPYFTYICDNERNTTENSFFECHINATDLDEPVNITLFSNYTWFLNETNASTTGFNASLWLNFTASNYHVGNWSINISARDTSEELVRTNSTIISFYVDNVNDSVELFKVHNLSKELNTSDLFMGFAGNDYTIYANATDQDLLIPGPNNQVYNENLTFSSNVSWIGITYLGDAGNLSKIILSFTANSSNVGNTTVNLSVTDENNFSSSSQEFIIYITDNNAPNWSDSLSRNFTLIEDSEFYLNLSESVSDVDGDSFTFLYLNLSQTNFSEFFSGANSLGIVNFTPTDEEVGFHRVTINATDARTPGQIPINFTVIIPLIPL